jgi:hypothetical protein
MAAKKKKKSESLGNSRAARDTKIARDKAFGKETAVYAKPQKPEKDSETYEYGNKKIRNTKFYSSNYDEAEGKKASILLALKRAKIKNLSNKEARALNENSDPKAKGKDFSKVTYSKVDSDAYKLVMERAKESGLSPKDADKAIKNAIRVSSANMKTDRSRTASRIEGVAKRELRTKQNKLSKGY